MREATVAANISPLLVLLRHYQKNTDDHRIIKLTTSKSKILCPPLPQICSSSHKPPSGKNNAIVSEA